LPTIEEQVAMVQHQAHEHLVDFSIAIDKKYNPNWHHEVIAQELEKAEAGISDWKILILCQPPRSGKSTQASIHFPAWYLGRNPDKEIITVSYSEELAVLFGSRTRELIKEPTYQGIFPRVRLRQDEKARAKWVTNKGGSYISVGVGGALTGRGANILIIDDPLKNRQEADSKLIRDNLWDFFTSTAYTRLEPNGKVIIILTRWHLDDLAGRILHNEEFKRMTKVISFPAIAIRDEKYRKIGEPLWPARYSLEDLESIKKSIGVYDFASLYQQNPVLTENQEFRPVWIKSREAREVDLSNTRKFLTVDTAISKKESADWTGFCDNAVDVEDNWNIRAWHMRVDPKELIDLLFVLYEKRGYEKIGIEKTIYLQAIAPFLQDEQIKRGKYLPVVELEHKQIHKETRIRGLIPRYAAGKIYHVIGECEELEEELFTFPFCLHDDILDSLAYQIQIAEAAYPIHVTQTVNQNLQTKNDINNGI